MVRAIGAVVACVVLALLAFGGVQAAPGDEVGGGARTELVMWARGRLSPTDSFTWEAPTGVLRSYDATGALIAEVSHSADEDVGTWVPERSRSKTSPSGARRASRSIGR